MERGPPDTSERPPLRAYLLVPAVYLLGAELGSRLTMTPEGISLLWPSTAVLLTTFLRYGGAGWWAFSLLGIAAEVVADLRIFSAQEALAFGVANVLEATLAWRILAAGSFDPNFQRIGDVGRFLLAAPLAGALAGATVGSGLLALARGGMESNVVDAAVLWWFGDALGLLVFTPVGLALTIKTSPVVPERTPRPVVDALMFLGGLLVLGLITTTEEGQLRGIQLRPFLLLPFVLYGALRLPFRGVALLVAVVSVVLVGVAAAGRAPYPGPAKEVWTQEFVAVMVIVTLGTSALLRCLRVAELEVLAANAALRRQLDTLERTNLELRRVNYVAAHELRTPLRGIGSFAQLLAAEVAGKLGPVADDWLRRIVENVRRLEALVSELGALSAVDAAPTRREPVDTGALVDRVVASLDAPLREAHGEVTRGDLPTIRGDRGQLAILLEELLKNAIQFRSDEPPRVHVSARRDGDEWVFGVRDNGLGLAAEHHARVFDVFWRLGDPKRREGPGGGLARCARIVHRHGGRIWLDSTPGVGTTFYFSIPTQETPT